MNDIEITKNMKMIKRLWPGHRTFFQQSSQGWSRYGFFVYSTCGQSVFFEFFVAFWLSLGSDWSIYFEGLSQPGCRFLKNFRGCFDFEILWRYHQSCVASRVRQRSRDHVAREGCATGQRKLLE